MSTSIDQRIVEMQFDNNQFERGAKQSIETLDKLDKSLDLRESAKNLTALSDAGKNFNMDGVASGIEIVQQKFSALEIVGITALQRITNQAITTGENLVKSLSLDQIGEGFGKYEQKTTSVQTIVNATGESIDSVSEKLAKLNWFTDETSYNFTDMIGNIGKFTSMGIDLNTSVTAMEGIANWAAISGQGVNEASRAMYNLSQAIGVGAVKLMDWKSIENANMATKEFKETAIETAKALGELNAQGETAKGTAVTVENFSSTLSDAWFTSDVLLKTLNKYGEYADEVYTVATEKGLTCAQAMEQVNGETMNLGERAFKAAQEAKTFTDAINSVKDAVSTGWANTFEIIFGNYEEAKRMWTDLANDLYDIFAGGTDDRNNFLEQVFGANNASIDENAWSKLFQNGIGGDAFKNAVGETAKAHGVAIDEMIAQEGDFQATLKKGWLTVDLVKETLAKYNGEVVTSTENVNDKLAEFNDLATKVIKGSYGNGAARKKALEEAGYDYAQIQGMVNKVLAGTQLTVEDLTEEQLKAVGATDEQTKTLQELAKQAEETGTPLNDLLEELNRPTGRELMIQSAANALQMVKQQMDIVKGSWDDVFPPVTAEQVYKLMQRIEKLSEKLVLSDDNADKLSRTLKGLFSILGIVKDGVTKLTKSGLKVLNALIGDVNLNILDYTSNIGDHIVGLREWLNTNTKLNAVIDKGTSFLVNGIIKNGLSGILNILNKLGDGAGNFGTIFSGVGSVIGTVLNSVWKGFKTVFSWFTENISLKGILGVITAIIGVLTGKKLYGAASGIQDFVSKLFNKIGLEEEKAGIIDKITNLFDSLHNTLQSFTSGVKVTSLLAIAAAIGILAAAMNSMSDLRFPDILKSLTAIGLMLGMLTITLDSMSKSLNKTGSKGLIKAGVSLILVAEAINILAKAMSNIGELSIYDIGKGLVGIGGGLIELCAALKVLDGTKVSFRTSLSMLALAESCNILVNALNKFGTMQWDEIKRGLVGMGGALSELVAALAILNKFGGGGSIVGAASIFVVVRSLKRLSDALKEFGNLSWDEIKHGLVGMGGALAEVGTVVGIVGKTSGFSSLLGSGGIFIAVQSLGKLAKAFKQFGTMQWDEIKRGLVGMGGALLETGGMAGALGTIFGFSGLLGSETIFITVQGLNDLANSFSKFGTMQWDEIKRGLVGMGGALSEIGVISGALGYLTNFAGLLGSGSLLLAIQGLNDLADAFYKFGAMSWDEISRGLDSMGGALSEVSLGALANTFSIFGASAIQKMAVPLGELADSIKKWEDVTLPDGMNLKLGALASGVNSFMFSSMGGEAIGVVAPGIGELADSVKKWKDVSVPQGIGTNLGSLANGVNSFMFSGLGASAINTMASSVGVLADSVKKWEDVTVPDNMGTKLTSFASGVNSFTFSGFGASAIDTVAESIGILADSVQKWSGVSVPSNIGEQLGNLSNGINSFSFSFLGAWSIETLNESFGGLAECVKQWNGVSIPEGLGVDLTDLANGVKSFADTDDFATNLKTFGEKFKAYYDKVSGIEPKKMANATNGLKGLVGVIDLLDGKDPNKLWTMGQAMQDLFSVDDSMYNNLELLYSNMQKTGETMIDRLMLGITNKAPNVKLTAQQTITNIIGDMATQIGTDQTVVIQAFEGMLNAAIEYLNSRKEDFGKYISSVCDEMITAMSDRYDDFANAGSYVIAGFVKGMKDAKMDAITAASNIALEAYSAACDTLDIHSPSKKFAWIGMQTDMGLAQGMLKYGRVAKEAAKRTASETVNAAQNSIYGIRGMFDGIDLTPIIRPIVDLDAVKNGVAQLNGMTTGMNTGLRLDTAYAYVSSAAASMDAKKANENQNGLEKVANELKALRDNPPVTMNNKFDITNPDPEAVANKAVSKIVRQIGRDTSRG